MDLHKLTFEDINAYEAPRLFEVEKEIRQEMAMIGMDVYSAQGQFSAKKVGLKKNLARVLTVRNQKQANTSAKVK